MYGRRNHEPDYNKPDYTNVAPPENLNNRQKYTGIEQMSQSTFDYSTNVGRQKRALKSEDDYFDHDDEEVEVEDSTNVDTSKEDKEDDDEEDPLDAFMAGIEKEVKSTTKPSAEEKPKPMSTKKHKDYKTMKGVRGDIEEEDPEESYYRFMEENPNAGISTYTGDSDGDDAVNELQYDADGNPIAPKKSKYIDPLPSIDHKEITYEAFEKNFYEEHQDIANLSVKDVEDLRRKLGIKVMGINPLKPVTSFGHFGLDEQLMKIIRKSEYTQPTPIQAQAIPIALSGRDLIGIAKTGSGKTAAYLWPLLVHIMDQRDLKAGEGPIGLILAPTRELTQQIYSEAKKFSKAYGLNIVCAYGGGSKWEQSKDLEAGAEIVVATPGRMIDMIKMKVTNLQRVTFLVLDEADRMFNMGFEPQVRSICDHVRPDRQTLMFSATFKKRVEKLARDVLTDPIKILQGELGEANEDVTQIVYVMDSGPSKWEWLTSKLVEFTSNGSVLIFVTKIANCEELASNLKTHEYELVFIHGDMDQADRNKAITLFKKKEVDIMVATDVASRGLDIPHVRTVINYDIARDIDSHTHRIGRTGRAGEKGVAYTLVTEKDKEFVGHLVRNLEGANQHVPDSLMSLAMQSAWFRKSRFKQGNVKRLNVGGIGLGFKTRPGLGAPRTSSSSFSSSSSTFTDSSYTEKVAQQMPRESASSSNEQSNRVAAMKAAFAMQFKTTFTAATDTAWKPANKSSSSSTTDKPRKKSRWE